MAISLGQTGEDLMKRSQSFIGQAMGRGTGMVADRLEHYTNLAREISDILRQRGEPAAADMIQTLSQRGVEVARYIRSSDGTRLWNDAQDFARQRTWLLTGVGFVSGLALARTIRTAGENAAWDSEGDYRDEYAQPYAANGAEAYRT